MVSKYLYEFCFTNKILPILAVKVGTFLSTLTVKSRFYPKLFS